MAKKIVDEPPLKKWKGESISSTDIYSVATSSRSAAYHSTQEIPLKSRLRSSKRNEGKLKTSEAGEAEFEKKPDYDDLLALDGVDLVSNVEKFLCPVCFFNVEVGKGTTLKDCLHSFCKKCLADAIQNSENAVIKCPFQNDEYSCESHLQEREIKSLVTSEVYEHHLQRSIALAESQAENSFHCKTPDCPGWCLFEDNVRNFLCPVCKHTNCLTCAAIHEGKYCQQYQNDVVLLYDSNGKQRKMEEYPQSGIHMVWDAKNEEKSDYHDLLALDDVDLVSNAEKFQCSVCLLDVEVGDGVILKNCFHSFCKMCLAEVIQISKNAVVKCPFVNNGYSCEGCLQEREVKSLVTLEVYERHLQKSIAPAESQAQNSFRCKTPDCPGWCFYENNVRTFRCPVCKNINCLTCAAIHEGKNCMQHQEDGAFYSDISAFQNEIVKADKSEKKASYQDLLALDKNELVSNVEKFECPICFLDIEVGEGVILKDCFHNFCKECLAGAIQFSENAFVKCPFQNDQYSCESHLQDREIKSLITPELYERHLQKSVALAESQAENSFHCKTPDCPGWCLFDGEVNTFPCPVCKHTNCLTCAAIHEGMDCKQYQDNLAFLCDTNKEAKKTREYLLKMIDKKKAMRCPKCQVILMKHDGCDGMVCTMCRTELCWVTKGPRWGPKGHGDTSGGCKCRVNGLCHPKCRGCH